MADQTQQYPKMLYQGGEVRDEAGRPVHASQTLLVNDAAEEKAAARKGFLPATEPEAEEVEDEAAEVAAEPTPEPEPEPAPELEPEAPPAA